MASYADSSGRNVVIQILQQTRLIRNLTGATGRVGPGGATGAAGSGFDWFGPWDDATAFVENQVVSYNNGEDQGSYIAVAPSINQPPTPGGNNAYWELVAPRGPQGETGDTGDPATIDAIEGLRWRGGWGTPPRTFFENDVVRDRDPSDTPPGAGRGKIWVCIEDHTSASSGDNGRPYQSSKWGLFLQDGIDGQDGSSPKVSAIAQYLINHYIDELRLSPAQVGNWLIANHLEDIRGPQGPPGSGSPGTDGHDAMIWMPFTFNGASGESGETVGQPLTVTSLIKGKPDGSTASGVTAQLKKNGSNVSSSGTSFAQGDWLSVSITGGSGLTGVTVIGNAN